MVDMSLTLLHHGHIRILKKAKDFGEVVVALTTDEEIIKVKGFKPLLGYNARKEILSAIRFVDEVVPCKWLIDDSFLDLHKIDMLIHGDDNQNPVSRDRLIIFPRTKGISSSLMRECLQKVGTLNEK